MTTRRTVLLLGAASVLAACGNDEALAMMMPLPAPSSAPLPAPSSAPPPVTRLRSVADWTNVFLQSWDYQLQTGLPLSRSADSWDHYNLSYSVDSCVAMFRATDEGRYLDRALQFTENVAAAATPSASLPHSSFHDKYLGWASSKNTQDGDEVPLYESYFWRYGTALLVAMRDARLTGDRYRRLLDFAEVQIFEKWYSRGPQDTVYRGMTHMSAHWALIALNLAQVTTDAARRARYLAVAGNFDNRMRQQLRRNPLEPTAYLWDATWGQAKRPGQDVSHGNGVMAYVTEARARGSAWTAADMIAFSSLLTRMIWPGNATYSAYVDGTGLGNGWFSDGFVKLGRYDAATQMRLDSHRVVNSQFAANMALNARILRKGGT